MRAPAACLPVDFTAAPPPQPAAQAGTPLRLDGAAELAEWLDRQIGQARRQGGSLALLLLEGLVAPADEALAPRLMAECARRICGRVRSTDHVLHWHPSQFAVLLPGGGEMAAQLVGLRLLHAASGPYRIEGQLPRLSLRVGTALYPADGGDSASLLQAAATSPPLAAVSAA